MFATSRDVASFFGKRHDHVLVNVDDILKTNPAQGVPNFREARYTHPQNGQSYREYEMTKDGFTLLTMGFNGAKAMEFKLRYIDEFNRMEAALKVPAQPALPDFTDPGEAAIAWGQQYKARKEAEALALEHQKVAEELASPAKIS